jgi:hypothetical protein
MDAACWFWSRTHGVKSLKFQDFVNRPNKIGQPRFHRGSDAQARMHAAEIVIREMQSDSSFLDCQFLREPIREPRQPSHCHANREVLPFKVLRHYRNCLGSTLNMALASQINVWPMEEPLQSV